MPSSMETKAKDALAQPDRVAAGFFLFRRDRGEIRYLVLWNARRDEPGFPKGHAEKGESLRETALRETLEETGVGDVRIGMWFERRMRYRVRAGLKEVVYFVGETTASDVTLSPEHSRAAWMTYDEVCATLTHDSLRAEFVRAGAYLKDAALRRGLTPSQGRALLIQHAGADASVVAHTTEVAAVARALADRCVEVGIEVNADFVETCAWLHDIGRSVAHDERHPLEGHRIVTAAGHPGYAPTCISHYTKGRSPQLLGLDKKLARAMHEACDLATFGWEEQLVALADAMVAGTKRVTLEARRDDLVARHGSVAFFEHAHRAVREIRVLFEQRVGSDLYSLLGL